MWFEKEMTWMGSETICATNPQHAKANQAKSTSASTGIDFLPQMLY